MAAEMIPAGRGRGWATATATAKNRESSLRRPGPAISPKDPEHRRLVEAIDDVVIYGPISTSTVEEIADLFRAAARTKGLRSVFDTLHEQALEDRQFGIKLAKMFSYDKIKDQRDDDGTKLRSILLSALQSDYEKMDETKDNCTTRYLNAVSLLGEVYYQVRIATGEPLPVIGVPLLDYMKSLLQSASEEDIELVATQLSLNGQKIHESNRTELERFLIHVRTVLVNRNLSSQSRAMLLLAVDLANQMYKPLSGDLQAFYLAQLGEETMIQLQRYQSVETSVTNKPKEQVNDSGRNQDKSEIDDKVQSSGSAVGMSGEKSSVDKSAKSFNRSQRWSDEQTSTATINPPPVQTQRASLPRAIRGLGIRDNKKENAGGDRKANKVNRKEKLTDEQVQSSKQNNSNKSWGHDDRFDRDYEFERTAVGNRQTQQNNTDNSQFVLD